MPEYISSLDQLPVLRKLGAIKPDIAKPSVTLASLVKGGLPDFGETYDVYTELKSKGVVIPQTMDGNDAHGCCVKAAQAKHIRVFEVYEQGKQIIIPTELILSEYYLESNGLDNGLNPDTSMDKWCKVGWPIDGNRYKAHVTAKINISSIKELHAGCVWLKGVQLTIALPISAMSQFIWILSDKDNIPGSWGYHQVYAHGWFIHDIFGKCIIFDSWGKIMIMSEAFYLKYCVLAKVVVDDIDTFILNSPLDLDMLEQQLNIIKYGGEIMQQVLTGIVTNKETGLPRVGKTITIDVIKPDKSKESLTAITDSKGEYKVQYQPSMLGTGFTAVATIDGDEDYNQATSPVFKFDAIKANQVITLGGI